MNQYTDMIGMSRISGSGADYLQIEKPSNARHIIVLVRDQIYKMDVLLENGERAKLQDLENQLFEIGKDSQSSSPEPPVGLLTAGHRDNWNEAYKKLNKSPNNVENLKTINSALFAVCLDDHSTKKNINLSHKQIFHNHNAHNRWFDKCIQIVVASSGRAGCNGEVRTEFTI